MAKKDSGIGSVRYPEVPDWPNAPQSVLCSAAETARHPDRRVAGRIGDRELPRFAARPPTRQTTGDIAAVALYAGESVDAVKRAQPAGEIVAELTVNQSRTTP
jgi:hypothetical protein